MIVAIGSDHAGFRLKETLKQELSLLAYSVIDLGTDSEQPVDYPDFAVKVAEAIKTKACKRGIIVCGSGVGASIVANKIKGIRAATCHDTYSAHQGVEHDDMNVLVLGSRVVGESLAKDIVQVFLSAQFSQEERHQRRLKKIIAIENG